MTIFLDACVIIYWIEQDEPYYSKFKLKLEKIQKKHPNAKLAISRLSTLECSVKHLKSKNTKKLKLYEDFFKEYQIIELNKSVIDKATHIRATTSLKIPDAIQAACAFHLKKLTAFVTNDKIFKKADGLPLEFI